MTNYCVSPSALSQHRVLGMTEGFRELVTFSPNVLGRSVALEEVQKVRHNLFLLEQSDLCSFLQLQEGNNTFAQSLGSLCKKVLTRRRLSVYVPLNFFFCDNLFPHPSGVQVSPVSLGCPAW